MPFYRSIVRQTAFVWAFLVVFAPLAAHADHHRGGRISWQRIDDTHAQINFQITFKRLVNTAGASGIGGYPRLNDNIRDP